MTDCTSTLENFLAPVSADDFFTNYWERDRLHISRRRSGLYDALFSLQDVDRWLASTKINDADALVLAAPEGADSGKRQCRPGEIAMEEIYDLFAKGYSLVLNRLEETWPPLARLREMLGGVFCGDIGINVYLTPLGSRTFPVHIDSHDVFVLQVYGTKLWRLHEFEHLPIMRLDYRKDLNYPTYWSHPERAPLLQELCLETGDLLYIPRGMPHCAIARDEPSLHLTVSINPLYWTDFFKAAVEQASFDAASLRRALPPRFVGDPEARESMRATFDKAFAEFKQHISFDDTLTVLSRRRIRAQGFPQDGHLAHLLRLGELTNDSELERRPNILCMVEFSEEYGVSSIRFGAAHVRGPKHLRRAFELIRDRQRFRVAELPGLDPGSQLTLVRRLMREGLLRFAEPQSPAAEAVVVESEAAEPPAPRRKQATRGSARREAFAGRRGEAARSRFPRPL